MSGKDVNLSAERLIQMLDNMNVQVMVADLETDEILYANRKMNLGYGIDCDTVGKRCWEAYQKGEKERCAFCPLDKLRGDRGATIEWEAYNSATGRTFRNLSSVIEWTNGRLAHFQQGVDITESKRVEKELRLRLEQQELLYRLSQKFISNTDTDTYIWEGLEMVGGFLDTDRIVITRLNKLCAEIEYCWHSDSKYEISAYESPKEQAGFIRRFHNNPTVSHIVCEDAERDANFEVMLKNGTTSFISLPVFVDNTLWGAVTFEMCGGLRTWTKNEVSFCCTAVNVLSGVLEREKNQKDISESEERVRVMLDVTPLACTFIDENYNIIDCNEEAARLYGMPSKQEYLDNFYTLLCPPLQDDGMASADKAYQACKLAFETGKHVIEWKHLHADGSEIPVEVTLLRVKWRDGYRVAGYARDLRESKKRMKQIHETQEALKLAKEKAEASARAKSAFLANMSHEIRTPMNAIIGMTEIAKGTDDIKRIKYCLDKTTDAANHLLGVINDILDMSKIDAGKFELSRSDFQLEKLLQQVSNVINFRIGQKLQEFVIKVDKDVPDALDTDKQRLAQVITNLLSNAVKFTPENGKIGLFVRLQEDLGNECVLIFEVVDNGIGISAEQQKKLFRSFEQADGSISRRFGGTGLGLAISKSIVELMGGQISVESEAKKGSRFYFTVRVRKGRSLYRSRLSPGVDWRSVHILVVDDDREIREYFEDVAASIGIKCTTLPDGYVTCDFISEDNQFQVVFVDWRMPGMDGIELTRKIRDKCGENVIIIMISAMDWDAIKSDARDAGVNDFIGKPLFPSAIIDCMNKCLGRRKVADTTVKRSDGGIFEGKRVLLAEDIDINREILISLLSDTGVEIICAENGRQAYDMFVRDSGRIDMVLMDIHMPEMDGYEATKRIRALGTQAALNVPIIAMTANVFQEDVERCLSSGMDDHIGKPVDTDEMLNKMKRHL